MKTKAEELAVAFCGELKEQIGLIGIRKAAELNDSEADHRVCHTHDFCDSNQVMLDAWERVFGTGTEPACIREGTTDEERAHDDRIWNRAWKLAKRARFNGAEVADVI